jgi:hypothetical protein
MTTLHAVTGLAALAALWLYWKVDVPLAVIFGTVSGLILGSLCGLTYWSQAHFEATIRLSPEHAAILVPYWQCRENGATRDCLDEALSRVNGGFEAVTFLMVMSDYGLSLSNENMNILQMRGAIWSGKTPQGGPGDEAQPK